MSTPTRLIRNFSIIAHIDHGKSTLADRLLDATDALTDRERKAQFLDSMDLERERGITIKAATVRLAYRATDGETYELNLIDTPGHVDFHYEVSRSLAACEGAVLVVDASQGVEAQTLANVYLAVNNNLTIVPVINKIDLPAADPETVRRQIEEVIGIDASEAILASAKEGKGIVEILEAVVAKVPPPTGDPDKPLRVLLLDSWYDTYRGVVILVRVIDGIMRPKQKIRFMAARRDYEVQTLGAFAPFAREMAELTPGEVGFFTAAIKEVSDARVGDTITDAARPCAEALPGFQPAKPMVFAGIFPTDTARYEDLRDALDKLRLNDASFTPRARDLGGARLRLSLRLPGPPAHGDRPGAARARVQPRPHHHRADGALSLRAPERRASSSSTTPRNSPRKGTSTGSRSRSSPSPSTPRRNTWGGSSSCVRRSVERRRGSPTPAKSA